MVHVFDLPCCVQVYTAGVWLWLPRVGAGVGVRTHGGGAIPRPVPVESSRVEQLIGMSRVLLHAQPFL